MHQTTKIHTKVEKQMVELSTSKQVVLQTSTEHELVDEQPMIIFAAVSNQLH